MSELRTDQQLLEEFWKTGANDAFRLLVDRHLGMVLGTARRLVRDEGLARDIAQNVFIALARKSWRLRSHPNMSGWLHKTTVLEARNWRRGERRRNSREQTAVELGTTMQTPEPVQRDLVAALDQGLMHIGEREREALILRFFEGLTHQEVGIHLGMGEDAARKRTEKGLRDLVRFLQKSGYALSSPVAAAALLSANAQAAPPGLAAGICTTAVASYSTPAALKAVLGLLFLLRLPALVKPGTLCLAVALPIAFQGILVHHAAREQARLRASLATLRSELASEESRLAGLKSRLSRALAVQNELSRRTNTANLYAWNAKSDYVRLPKRIFSTIVFVDPNKPFERQHPELFPKTLTMGSGDCPFFDREGSPQKLFMEALDLTEAQCAAVTELCRDAFTRFRELSYPRSYLTNDPAGLRIHDIERLAECYAFVTPSLGADADTLAERFERKLSELIGQEKAAIFSKRSRYEVISKLNDFGRSTKVVALFLFENDEIRSGCRYEPEPRMPTWNHYAIYGGGLVDDGIWLELPPELLAVVDRWKAGGKRLQVRHD